MSLPPAFAASALYDSLLQAALRQFFARATFETEATASLSSDGRLAIEPTGDPAALTIRWFGSRHRLHVPARRPFTAHEIRFAQAIGSVLAARYRAIFDPRLMAERGDLFRGAIEDRYVGAFLDGGSYRIETGENRADRIATAIEVLRVAGLSSYENRPIASGVLLLGGEADPVGAGSPMPQAAHLYSTALTGIKSFYRLCDGLHTVFLVNRAGVVLDIVEIERWAAAAQRDVDLKVPCVQAYSAHVQATLGSSHVCVVLSPTHEIKVFAEGVQLFSFRNASWHLLDLQAKYEMWTAALGNRPVSDRLFQSALDLSDRRQGALFAVLRDPAEAVDRLLAPGDQLDRAHVDSGARGTPTRRDLMYLLANQTVTTLDPAVFEALASMDGATVMDPAGELLAVGAILMHPAMPDPSYGSVEGARTTAAMAACRFGPVLKVSEDGGITFFDEERIWDL